MGFKGIERDLARKYVGRLGENIAAKFLASKGYEIVERNYRKTWGEIDIIGVKDEIVRFVEVKTISRESKSTVSYETSYRPEEQVHAGKIKKISRTADLYMASKHDQREYQIDVVGVILDTKSRVAHCRLFEQVL